MVVKNRLKLPEYVIPYELKEVLDNNLEDYSGISIKSGILLAILKALKSVDQLDLSENHYLQLLKLALYLEAYQCQNNPGRLKRHTLLNKSIAKLSDSSSEFQITIAFTGKDKPRIKTNDVVVVIDTTDKTRYRLKVTNVTETHIVVSDSSARFSTTFATDKHYDIKFCPPKDYNYPRRCAHLALWLMHERNALTYLFPLKSKAFIQNNAMVYGYYKAINPAVHSNPEQKQAILSIINKSSFPAPYILYGPPGTGKTATLVEAMCQLHRDFPTCRILVCTPSNTAADEITRRLLKFIDPNYIYRIYSQSKDGSTIDKEILTCSNYRRGKFVEIKLTQFIGKRIVISTMCNTMRLLRINIPKDHFSHLFIDEVGQSIEPDVLIPISLVSGDGKLYSQIVLAGDPQQLGPTISSKLAEAILGRSILERLMSYDIYQKDSENKYNSNYITKLLRNYRSHPDILQLPNKLFYDDELIPMLPCSDKDELFPVIFHGVEGEEEKTSSSPSSCNHKEIQLVMKYVGVLLNNELRSGKVLAEDIGIITPFAHQSELIQNRLTVENINGINVGTVDSFQGQERKIIIMTTVRSQTFVHNGFEHIGFLSNFKRFNVAITRAKSLFIVVGNPGALQTDDNWRMLMEFCKDNDSYQGVQISFTHLNGDEEKSSKTFKIVSSTSLFEDEMPNLFLLYEAPSNPDKDKIQRLIDSMRKQLIVNNYDDDQSEDDTW